MVGEMRLAGLATIHARRIQVHIVRETHGDGDAIGGADGRLLLSVKR